MSALRLPQERPVDYIKRLDTLGYDEVFIQKAVFGNFRHEFGDIAADMVRYFETHSEPALRYITLLLQLDPERTRHSLEARLHRGASMSRQRASRLVALYYDSGGPEAWPVSEWTEYIDYEKKLSRTD